MAMSLIDYYNLPSSLKESIKVLGGDNLADICNLLDSEGTYNYLKIIGIIPEFSREPSFRKLSFFPDKEDKVRVIAQLDYFSQTVLRPLHKFLYKVLRKLPNDCTHDQGKFLECLKDSSIYFSIDLSSATDRFPIKLIKSLLEHRLPTDYVNAWEDIMVGYPFDFTNRGKVNKLSYSVGNPMGAYSS